MEKQKKLIPYSVYIPEDHHNKLKQLAKERKASEMIRNAIDLLVNNNDVYKAGYNKALEDASRVIYDCKEAQMVAVNGRDLGAHLHEQVKLLVSK